jgi:transcriptional regulator with XRE-family HTH domain
MPDSFGARLRRQRERQKIELTAIAEQTKISLALLEGLERDDIERWPAGIFRRSFVRSYAQAIGLDPDAVVHEFLELFPDPSGVIDPISSLSSAAERPEKHGPPTRLRNLVDRAIDAMPGHTAQRGVLAHGTAIEISKSPASRPAPKAAQPDLLPAAQLCTELAQVTDPADVPPILERAAKVLDAVGLVVWVWDPQLTILRPAVAHGYPDAVLAQLLKVCRETDNPTVTAFRSSETRIVPGTGTKSGALIVPLMTPTGCRGVFAIELERGLEGSDWVLAIATIFAAQLSTLVDCSPVSRAVSA